MDYDIVKKNDFSEGASLVIRVPTEELDVKALRTIDHDAPDFLVPFLHKEKDGFTELTYKISSRCSLRYINGQRSVKEYIELWKSIISPLLDAEDWFMTPYSFVMEMEYLYYDKSSDKVNYIYVPALKGVSDDSSVKSMVLEISKYFRVSDAALENKVLRSIMEDFRPADFLKTIKSYKIAEKPAEPKVSRPSVLQQGTPNVVAAEPSAKKPPEPKPPQEPVKTPPKPPTPEKKPGASDDIFIEMFGNNRGKPNASAAVKHSDSGKKKGKESHAKDKKGKSTEKSQAVFYGAASEKEEEKRKAPVEKPQQRESVVQKSAPASVVNVQETQPDGVTQIDEAVKGTRFRRVGNPELPEYILVTVEEGKFFSIGRFDASVNIKQSDFEFDKKTRAVSRHHAVIERVDNTYTIVDLNSSAGTFVNSQRLNANSPYELKEGDRVSFGTAGADYIFEK